MHIDWICKSVKSPAFLLCATKLDQQGGKTEEAFNKVFEIAREQIKEICQRSNLADRKITLAGEVIMTSVRNVGQPSQFCSMSDLAKYINSLTEMASEGKVFIPKSWETFGKKVILCCIAINIILFFFSKLT